MPEIDVYQIRSGVASDWALVNPVLMDSEPGFELDTRKIKVGDGITDWNDLPYVADPSANPGSDMSLIAWSLAQAFSLTGSQVYDSTYGTLTSSDIAWPDATPGAYTASLDTTSLNPGGVTQFIATYLGTTTKTVTVTIPRDGSGNISGDMTAVVS